MAVRVCCGEAAAAPVTTCVWMFRAVLTRLNGPVDLLHFLEVTGDWS